MESLYTPDHIVRYIVDHTLGAYLREHEAKFKHQDYRNYQAFLRNIKVLDPACGSGAFLLHVSSSCSPSTSEPGPC